MAKGKNNSNDTRKISFGKRKKGSASKSRNKHDRSSRVYRGQGR
jgi:hypothetical protein